jgi:dTDP-4-dehydrorhamnose 3,5-epimerase
VNLRALDLPGVLHLVADVHGDVRGSVRESWHAERYAALGVPGPFVQVNHAHTVAGGLRGLHWQVGAPQGKLVTVVRGRIRDVVVDVRRGLPTSGRSVAVELDADRGDQLWVPEGYAHGFVALGGPADVVYLFTRPYEASAGRGVRWDDADLAVPWGVGDPVVGARDAALPRWSEIPAVDLP